MKQKFLMLLAVVLLSCVSAFAQSGNNEPLKGDVNEDGKVDVADIAAVINIMKNGGGTAEAPMYYWYAGYNNSDSYINASNYTSIASQVTTLPASTDINPVDSYVYVVAPKAATIRVFDPNTNFDINMKTLNSSTGTYTNAVTEVGDYKLYRSAQLVVGTTRITAQ